MKNPTITIQEMTDFLRGTVNTVGVRPSHAYTISRVNRDEEKIFIINPHDTSRDLEVTFEQCKEGFSQIEMARINYNTLIQRIEDLEERSKEWGDKFLKGGALYYLHGKISFPQKKWKRA